MNNTHRMTLERTYPSGAEEWGCPSCRRRIIIGYSTGLEIVVLNVGDDISATHSGSNGGLTIDEAQVREGRANPLALSWMVAPSKEDKQKE